MTKPVIIFGAGASYDVIDSADHDHSPAYQPPLTNNLFSKEGCRGDLINLYPRMRKLMPEIRSRIKNRTLEEVLMGLAQEMGNMNEESRENRKLQLIEVELYLKILFTHVSDHYLPQKDVNNYVTFLTKLKDSNITEASIVTFNYDLFLDRALSHVFGYQYKTIADYHKNSIKYYKVHGSVDWHYPCSWTDIYDQIPNSDHALRIMNQLKSNLSLKNRPPTIKNEQEYHDHVIEMPHLAIPEPTDKGFQIEDHADMITNDLKKTNKVIVIGWSASDEYFVDLIAKNISTSQTELVVIGTKNAPKTFRKINSKVTELSKKWLNNPHISQKGFSGLWAEDEIQDAIFS